MSHHPNLDEYVRQIDSGERDYWSGGRMPADLGPLGWWVVRPWGGTAFVKRCYATAYICCMEGPYGSFDEAYATIADECQ